MDLDACLEEPVFIALYKYCFLQLLKVEACVGSRLSSFGLLCLLIVACCLFCSLLTNAFKESEKLFIAELEPQ